MRILLAVDGSPHSLQAADEIAHRPWPSGTVVRVLSAVQAVAPPAVDFGLASGVTFDQFQQEQTRNAHELTEDISRRLQAASLRAEATVVDGDPGRVIVDEARNWGADLIVVGSHGHSKLERWLLGSVARSIVDNAPCSVEVVRRREAQAA
jgi:nucleotide-binding universal stress UspA family protein